MHLISTVLLCLLTCGPILADTITYFIDQPLNTTFTIFDNFNDDIVGLGVGDDGILELQPNSTTRWHFEQIYDYNYIIRESNSQKYIHFAEPKLGAIATVSETAATVLDPTIYSNALFRFYLRHEGPGLFFTVEKHSTEQPNRYVIKLRDRSQDRRQLFSFLKPPKNGS